MASELRVNTLKDASGNNSVGMAYVAGGSAKAWASFDQISTGHPVYTDSSLNTSSTADVATGVTKITFTNSFNNATYGISGSAQSSNTGGTAFSVWGVDTVNSRQMTTSYFHTDFRQSTGSNNDTPYTAYNSFGDLA